MLLCSICAVIAQWQLSPVKTILAGSGTSGSADGTGAAASFSSPAGLALSADYATLFVAEYGNHRIRQIAISTGVVTTVAGSGSPAFADGTGVAASFAHPQGLIVSPDGTTLFVADVDNSRVRQLVISSGVVTTLAGSGSQAFADGTGAAASFHSPHDVAVSPDGTNLYVADHDNCRIRQITISSGVVTTLAGSGSAATADGTGAAASFNFPIGLAVLSDGTTLFVAEHAGHRIRQIATGTGVVTTLAGSGTASYDDGTGAAASFNFPRFLALSPDDSTLYVSQTWGDWANVRQIDVSSVSVRQHSGPYYGPQNMAVSSDGSSLYVADRLNHRIVLATNPDIIGNGTTFNAASGQCEVSCTARRRLDLSADEASYTQLTTQQSVCGFYPPPSTPPSIPPSTPPPSIPPSTPPPCTPPPCTPPSTPPPTTPPPTIPPSIPPSTPPPSPPPSTPPSTPPPTTPPSIPPSTPPPSPPPLTPPSTPPPSSPAPIAQITGDPHVHGAHGDSFDFKGADGGIYVLLSAPHLSMAAQFKHETFFTGYSKLWVHGSWIKRVYWTIRTASNNFLNATFDVDDPRFNGTRRATRRQVEGVTFAFRSNSLTVTTPQWPRGAHARIAPHGLLGQTYDGDNMPLHGRRDSYSTLDDGTPTLARKKMGGQITTRALGEGAIEGSHEMYPACTPSCATVYEKFEHKLRSERAGHATWVEAAISCKLISSVFTRGELHEADVHAIRSTRD
ncbi:hypothetical protein AB1Y20_000125 [Prymnesium parvum]|uniref:SMP-30/Gluconolactonase/LRE-like region domain-containing protein n=1 Tax=Prymnesium parvum TaxID=97485 RepID=A0AB34K827_PRYPA